MKVHHIGIIVKDIDKSEKIYEKLSYKKMELIHDKLQNIKIQFMINDNDEKIELIQSLDKNSSIHNFKPGYHHICYELSNQEKEKFNFSQYKIGKIFTNDIVAQAINNRTVVFACLTNQTFIEFLF
ncbi:MAG: VOC family protein [Clostridium sp.]